MAKYRDGWNDPPPSGPPRDWDCSVAPPITTNYVRRGLKRGLVAFATAALTGLTYALMPIAFAVGGAALGVWWAGATFYEWLESQSDEEPLRS